MKYVYSFEEGNKDMRDILGGKGANLAEMTALGLPVPSGFIISTEVCKKYYENQEELEENIILEIKDHLNKLENKTNKIFGDDKNPLLVSVRSGAPVSMPGMMDTILNLGLNDKVVEGFCIKTKNERFVYDSYRRFIQMFADVVMGFPKSSFERKLDEVKKSKNIEKDIDLTTEDLKEIVDIYKEEYKKYSGENFP